MNRFETRASAKVNLTLRVLDKRPDGYHDLVSLVAFADIGDQLALVPGNLLELVLTGPNARATGDPATNLVLVAARALAEHVEGLKFGRFELSKYLPIGAGLGGGSADAAAALRLLAEANGLSLEDPRVRVAAEKAGADVPVCLHSEGRLVTGIGEHLSPPLALPPLPAAIVFPGVSLATVEVFDTHDESGVESLSGSIPDHPASSAIPLQPDKLIAFLNSQTNDLARAAHELAPVIALAEERLYQTDGVHLVRMSGSGSSVFALYDERAQAERAIEKLRADHAEWWMAATILR